jgi:hypothetical protein
MIPLLALGGAAQAADAAASGMAWLTAQLSPASQISNTSSSENGSSTAASVGGDSSDPTSFASILAAQGAVAPAGAPAAAAGGLPTMPTVSAAGQAVAGGHSHSGGGHGRVTFTI